MIDSSQEEGVGTEMEQDYGVFVTLLPSNQDFEGDIDEMTITLTDAQKKITDLKDIAAAWLIRIVVHKYTDHMRADIDNFVIKCMIVITEFERVFDNLD